MMKRVLIAALCFSFVLPACRKGEDDPLVSLLTRKNRLTGEWQIERYEHFRDYGGVRLIRYAKDTGLIYTLEDSSTYQRGFNWTMAFQGDGSYTSEQREDFPADSGVNGQAFTLITTERGEWKFTGGNGVPNRSELIFLTEELTTERTDQGSNIDIVTVHGPVEGEVYQIDRLANSEVWLSYSRRVDYPFYSERDSVIVRFVKE